MRLQLVGKLNNVFKSKDFENSKTGEVQKGKYKLEFMYQKDLGGSHQNVIEYVSIPDSLYPAYKDKIGKDVTLDIGIMAKNNKVIIYGVENN